MRTDHNNEAIRAEEPGVVRTIGWVYVVLGGLAGAAALLLRTSAPVLLVSAVLQLVVGWGLVTGRAWAYFVALALAAVNTISGLVLLVQGVAGILVPLLVNGLVLGSLVRHDVRRWAGLSGNG